MKRKNTLVAALLFLYYAIQAQYIPKVLPPSPNAYSLYKVKDVEIDKMSGTANFSIPIFEIIQDGVSIPIQISYNTGGIRVDERSSSVGLGWGLNIPYDITKQVHGYDDDNKFLFLPHKNYYIPSNHPNSLPSFDYSKINTSTSAGITQNFNFLSALFENSITGEVYDTQPDMYYYKLGSLNGKFFRDTKFKSRLIPYQPIEILSFSPMKIQDLESNTYEFERTLNFVMKDRCSSFSLLDDFSGINNYKISNITTRNKTNILFRYNHNESSVLRGVFEMKDFKISGLSPDNAYLPGVSINCQPYKEEHNSLITEIIFDQGRIEFKYNTIRNDLESLSSAPAKSLDEIIIYSKGNNPSNNETRSPSFFTLQGINVYYTKNAFPTEGMTLLTVNYYDTYPRDAPAVPTTILGQHTLQQILGGNDDASTNSLPTVAYVKNIEDDAWTKTFNYYDSGGKLIATNTINHLGGYTNKELKLDYIGQVDESYTTHAKTMGAPEIKIKERFIYDNQQRLVKQYHQVNSQLEELLADNTYNDLGQLINKKTGNTTGVPLQSIDQSYNIRGWLTKVNDPANLNGKLFAYELKYQNPVYSTVSQGKYNGNIAEVDWVSADDGKLRRYNYKYDGLERLKDGIYSEPATTAPRNDYYNESLSYDVNGNIMSLKRNRYIENTGRVLMDDLGYTYMGNRLTKVNDTSGNYSGYPSTSGNAIAYDTNGNMINHIDKGMLQIDYNFLNLPTYIKFDKQYESHELRPSYYVNTKYLYNAQGTKLRKIHTYGTGRMNIETIMTTDYLDGFQYTNNELSFVPTSEGYYDFVQNKYIYNYTDQVGNIRLAYYKDASGNLQMDRVNHYYPFGLEFGGDLNITGTISPNYKYSSQGQEKQLETGWSSYRWRNYDAAMGRFFSIDPLSEKYAYQSHYNFSENRVVDGRELEGLEWANVKNDKGVTTSRQLTVSITNSSTKLNDKQFNKLVESIKTDFSKTYGADGAKASLVVSDKATIKANVVDEKGTVVKDADGNEIGVAFKGGVADTLGDSQKNGFTVAASNDGEKRGTSDITRSFNHEAGHTVGLRHPFDPKQEVTDVKQGATGVKTSTITSNLMNSDANKINPSSSGTTITKSQFKKMDELIQSQQPK